VECAQPERSSKNTRRQKGGSPGGEVGGEKAMENLEGPLRVKKGKYQKGIETHPAPAVSAVGRRPRTTFSGRAIRGARARPVGVRGVWGEKGGKPNIRKGKPCEKAKPLQP